MTAEIANNAATLALGIVLDREADIAGAAGQVERPIDHPPAVLDRPVLGGADPGILTELYLACDSRSG